MKSHFLAIGILSIVLFTSCKKEITTTTDIDDTEYEAAPQDAIIRDGIHRYVPNELLIKFKAAATEKSITRSIASIEGTITEHIITTAMIESGDKEGIYLISTPYPVAEARMKMKNEDEIEYAEPNYIYQHCGGGSIGDTYYKNGNLWGMYGNNTDPLNIYGSGAGEAWAKGHTGSSSVFVGVIDEGSMFIHEDLSANMWTNPFDKAGDGIDNDRNGYVDDIRGWDFYNNDNTTFDGTANFYTIEDAHGTHVSGIIGARQNAKGVIGVNWNIKMISAKIFGSGGGTTANAIKAVDYFTDLKIRRGLNIVATNNSWGGGGFSQGLQDAITRAGNANILFVAAAGNNSADTEINGFYPAGYNNSNIISVASINSTGGLSPFSNYAATRVDIGAPGERVYSTLPAINRSRLIAGYGSYSGTSMAAPHVTGAAALYASTHPGATADQIKAAILNSAVPTESLSGKCVTGGRLNISGF